MTIVRGGQVLQERPTPSITEAATGFFWGFLDAVNLYFSTLVNPSAVVDVNNRGQVPPPSGYGNNNYSSGGSGGPRIQRLNRTECEFVRTRVLMSFVFVFFPEGRFASPQVPFAAGG
eukprot:TRINITY_DN7320_c0_g1_i1.p1 TRINITY_DN7320_c0_g1~~TRINITY_DN7320_c0_g1_i1.p1  ORF type:complete len:117 (+),score=17.89 TRINITY_DN7320_c0_g1_i1:53-403(+)